MIETDTGACVTAIGKGQSHGTAAVTAIAAERLARTQGGAPRYLWDVIDAAELITETSDLGILVSD